MEAEPDPKSPEAGNEASVGRDLEGAMTGGQKGIRKGLAAGASARRSRPHALPPQHWRYRQTSLECRWNSSKDGGEINRGPNFFHRLAEWNSLSFWGNVYTDNSIFLVLKNNMLKAYHDLGNHCGSSHQTHFFKKEMQKT